MTIDFCNIPSPLQNVGIQGCQPICMPEDVVPIAKENRAKLGDIQQMLASHTDTLDIHSSILVDMQSKIDCLVAGSYP